MSNEKKSNFLVGFDPSLSSLSLKIPCKFAKLVCGKIPGTATLLGPSGHTWHVNIVQLNGELCFRDGWVKFVRDNSMELGDSLVFRYDGDLRFSVLIFDQSKCEKEAAFSSDCSQDSRICDDLSKKRERENPGVVNSIVEAIPKRIRSSLVPAECLSIATCPQPGGTSSFRNSECISITSAQPNIDLGNKKGFPEEVSGIVRHNGETSMPADEMNVGCMLANSVTIAVPPQIVGVVDSEATLSDRTDKEEFLNSHEAERVARSFTSPFPNFTKVMKKFNISGSYTLNIPYQFATVHLPKCKVKIVLHNLRGERWTINSVPTARVQTSHTFCGGWLSFVRDNCISLGDICIFELVGKCELRVRVIRVIKEGMEDHNKNEMCKVMSSSSCDVPSKISRCMTQIRSRYHHNAPLQWSECGAMSENFPPFLLSKSQERVVWEGSSAGRLGFQTKGFVSLKSGPEEKLAAQSFLSIFPHFVRIMKNFNVGGSYTLKIPYQFSKEHLPNCRTEITLRNLQGKSWTVNSITTTKVQTLHTFCGGWMAFVRDNDIQVGDICIFELVGKQEMRVHVCGHGKQGLTCHNERASPNDMGA